MVQPTRIESALHQVRDQRSFIQEFLVSTLGWPIDEGGEAIEDIAYEWSERELRAAGLHEELVGGRALQIVLPQNPWGIFILEFLNPEVFVSGRGMTGVLRRILNGLVIKKRSIRDSRLPGFRNENLLFICNHRYERYRFAYFKAPKDNIRTQPLASFGWGPDDLDAVRTICEYNLSALVWPDHVPTDTTGWVATWASAFDVEKVTERFYQDYANVFHSVEALIGKHARLKADELRMFTQSLFNRLMLLRFVEKKGWLKFPGQQGTRYLASLASAGGIARKSIYSSRLRPLFFEGLAREGKQQTTAYGSVPLLNGGLFEVSELDSKVADVPDEAIKEIIAAGKLFYRYNFTVEESTPLDVEVAVDPEMLGKVFEELVTGRHESGSYYTPRPVVAFMCREAVRGHLAARTNMPAAAITDLVDNHVVDTKTLEQHKGEIDEALIDIRAVDPACGSGAYLLGFLYELIMIRRALSPSAETDKEYLYKLKLHIISHNLYGVDIDPFATEIAKLRLWLSLAVEADSPLPLPNLDFKIETGDSLLGPSPQAMPDLFQAYLRKQANLLQTLKEGYLSARGTAKVKLKSDIATLEKEVRKALYERVGPVGLDWRIQFAEVFGKAGGFDVVLANPPYVRKENIPADIKPILRKNFGSAITGRSDLYCSFYARAVQLLRGGGMHVFICSSAWLDAEYGAQLQDYLLKKTNILAVYDSSVEKQFSTANVNTIITVLRKKDSSRRDQDSNARFVLFEAPFAEALRKQERQRVVLISQDALRKNGQRNAEYVGDKWGGKYLRAPEIYKRVVNSAKDRLVLLSDVARVVGYIHDNNTGRNYPKRDVMWRVSDATCIFVDKSTEGVQRVGVSPTGNSTMFAPLLFPRQHGLRHIVLWCHEGVLGKEFYRIVPHKNQDVLALAAQLISTFGILQREILGIKGFGGGALKFAARDVELFQVLTKLKSDTLKSAMESIMRRPIGHGVDELRQGDRRVIDRAIFDELELTENDRQEIYDAVIYLLELRQAKARTT